MTDFLPCPFCKQPGRLIMIQSNDCTLYRVGCVNRKCKIRPATQEYSTYDGITFQQIIEQMTCDWNERD